MFNEEKLILLIEKISLSLSLIIIVLMGLIGLRNLIQILF